MTDGQGRPLPPVVRASAPVRLDLAGGWTDVPPFATRLRLDLEQDTAYATSYLRIMDALGTTRAHVYANSQPDQGLPLGSAHNVYVMATASWRVTYLLQL